VNISNVVLKATEMPEWRKSFEAEDSDFGGGAWVPWKFVSSSEWVPLVPRIWEREITDLRPTEADLLTFARQVRSNGDSLAHPELGHRNPCRIP
jgi:hypothetical protein